jgi:ectoine hydroxylase-related dioxygenase (phytanoyl-CoA dioxygenase family)
VIGITDRGKTAVPNPSHGLPALSCRLDRLGDMAEVGSIVGWRYYTSGATGLNEQERYLFDLQGFIVVENALSSEQLSAVQQSLDRAVSPLPPDKPNLRFDRLLTWGEPFQDLIDNPRINPYLTELLGHNFRLDHDYVHLIRQGEGPIGSELHGGGTPYDPCQYYQYRDGRMYNGLTAVAYSLTDSEAGWGGFGCIPGSHKSNLPLPFDWRDLNHPPACVREVSVKAGSAILFTEALTHGTLPWRGPKERRTLFYKYSPRPSAWTRYYYNPAEFSELSDRQQKILATPGLFPVP